ncbi:MULTISPECIES: helix-turn-helix domain-containing protein [Pseudomonas]|uniref:AraC family transcriptional regulator n=1 Tax=Pseudomonas fulva TaxID=47880 RepID=A0A0D0KGG5_9PSED|nr:MULTISPECIES: helix-turn-helix domain-containing protein [Pseudomonas]KIP98404.1 AraC family transcriptional regulator [Pseudomonas fulva]
MHSHAVVSSNPGSVAAIADNLVHYRQTQDIEEHAQSLQGWQLRYDQLGAGQFSGELTEIHLSGMQLIRDRASQAMVKNGAAWPGAITFSMPLSADPHFHCTGHSIHQPSLLVARSEQLPELRVPGGLDLICIAIDEQPLQEALQRQQRELDLKHLPKCYRLLSDANQQELVRLFGDVLDQYGNGTALLDHITIRGAIRDAILMHLLELMDSEDDHPLPLSARKRMVDRARDYALANCDRPLNILELCNQIGASRRKLQYCFQETLGTNPVAYLRALRLNAVHRQLRQGNGTDSVQAVAANWGFWHLSRFATDYRQLFGERPSDTLRRARGVCAEIG